MSEEGVEGYESSSPASNSSMIFLISSISKLLYFEISSMDKPSLCMVSTFSDEAFTKFSSAISRLVISSKTAFGTIG